MKCERCGQREANFSYYENINGYTKEMHLCEKCSQELGLGNIKFNMPMDFSNFFGDFIEEFKTPEFMPLFNDEKQLKCEQCGYTFEDIIKTGKFGCGNCYDTFADKIEPIIKKIQGSSQHIGRLGKISENKIDIKPEKEEDKKELTQIEKLKEDLKKAIQEERYEDAAKIRDEIKKIS